MSETDDIDERFAALTAQIPERERRRMSRSATRERTRPPRSRRSRRRWTAVAAATALVAAAGAFVTYRPDVVDGFRSDVFGSFSGSGRPGGGTGRTNDFGTDAAGTDTPFAGSPAAAYADGAKGLVMPPARAMGGLSRKEVAAVLRRAKDLLVAAHLDREVLLGGRPERLIRLLDPEQRKPFVRGLARSAPKGGYRSREWVTSLAPGSAELVGDTFKVHGKSRLSVFRENGLKGVRIKVNYLFVYAIRRPGRPETLIRLVAHNVGTLDAWRQDGRLRFWVPGWNGGGVAPARCDVDDGFVHPFYPDSAPDAKLDRTAAPVDPYSLEEESSEECTWLRSGT